jgi:hypothetical protein
VPRPNFHNELFLAPFEAAGPIDHNQRLDWVWVWLVQNIENAHDKAAAARGSGGPFGPPNQEWRVPLNLATADAFTPDWPAQATAVALVKKGGKKEAYWWSEAVMIRP